VVDARNDKVKEEWTPINLARLVPKPQRESGRKMEEAERFNAEIAELAEELK